MSQSVRLLRDTITRMENYSDKQIALNSGLSKPTIFNIRNAFHSPTIDTLSHIERALDKLDAEK